MNLTIIVWSDSRMIVQHLHLLDDKSRGFASIDTAISHTVHQLRLELGMKQDDPRWVAYERTISVEMRVAQERLLHKGK